MKSLHVISFFLVFIGAINWGLIGLADFNLVNSLGLPMEVEKVVYVLVGLGGVYLMLNHKADCSTCESMMMNEKPKKKGKK